MTLRTKIILLLVILSLVLLLVCFGWDTNGAHAAVYGLSGSIVALPIYWFFENRTRLGYSLAR